MNKRALSPLVATILLVVFALVIGTLIMNWGRSYVENIKEEPFGSAIMINTNEINTPLMELQIQYLTHKISQEEYVKREKELING